MLNMGWFAIRKRGTGRHHLYALLGMTITGLITMIGNDWYIFSLTSHQGRVEVICSLARQAGDAGMSCHAQWLLLTLVMTIFLALLGAANVTMLLFAFKIISHGHKRKVAMVQGGQEEKTEYKLW
ncbi:hypothetical protein BCR35DRAFT_311514 [Leucosporidium creatinivorum]|uniref:Uncharacterized protein n=1 Tax=Leucosporidium creatinivorum TaxID=106004 RepID=A0A1Y2BVZ3_9BASI|nr:hypothetical protein BCR35DRAFT_311514 [Leucosporidium creatinivorum]